VHGVYLIDHISGVRWALKLVILSQSNGESLQQSVIPPNF